MLTVLADIFLGGETEHDREIRTAVAADGVQHHLQETGAVFHAAAELIGPLVHIRGEELMDQILMRAVDGDTVKAAELDVAGGTTIAVGDPGDLVRCHLTRLLAHETVARQGTRGDEVFRLHQQGMHFAAGVVDLHHAGSSAGVDRVGDLGKLLHRIVLGGADALQALQAGDRLHTGEFRHDKAYAAFGTPAVERQ